MEDEKSTVNMAQVSATYVEDKPLTPTPTTSKPSFSGRRPRILVVNDDGAKSSGLKQLALELEEIGDVVVVSTIDNQIHPSFSITIQETIRAKKLPTWGQNILVFAVAGFPMNCLKYAYGHVIPNLLQWDSLDIVVAGINKGRNVGTDLLYSGTMSLACASRFGNESFMKNNVTPKAIAISLCPPSMKSSCSLSSQSLVDWDFNTAVKAAKQITKLALDSEQTPNVVWNVNIPGQVKSTGKADQYYWAVTRPAKLKYDPMNLITITKDEDTHNDFVINGPEHGSRYDIGTDLYALNNGVISISPIEVSPSLHTPLHASSNLIDLFKTQSQLQGSGIEVQKALFWSINANIRPLQCIVQCLEHWLRLKEDNGNDTVLLQTYTLYLERDIKICPLKAQMAGILTEQFGWSPQYAKFNSTLSWEQMRDLCTVLKDIDYAKNGRRSLVRYLQNGALFVGAVALCSYCIEYVMNRKRSSKSER